MDTHHILEALAEDIAERIASKVAAHLSAPPVSRIQLVDVTLHGAPSARWVRAQARAGAIVIKGPRGGRYVDADALAEVLGNVTIKRPTKERPEAPDDPHAMLAEMAAKRGVGR